MFIHKAWVRFIKIARRYKSDQQRLNDSLFSTLTVSMLLSLSRSLSVTLSHTHTTCFHILCHFQPISCMASFFLSLNFCQQSMCMASVWCVLLTTVNCIPFEFAWTTDGEWICVYVSANVSILSFVNGTTWFNLHVIR